MIMSALESMEVTSANPDHINTLIQVKNIDVLNLDETIKQEIERVINEQKKESSGVDGLSKIEKDNNRRQKKEITKINKKFKRLDEGNVGEMTRLTSAQFGNLKSFAQNPTGMITSTLFRKFAKGAGVLLLATLIFEAVQFVINELLKPGRLLDIRFKRNINEEILAFRRREEKQKLKQGFSRIIVTSMPRLRGGQDQVYDTYREIQSGRSIFPNDTFMVSPVKGDPVSVKSKGKGKRNRSAFR